MAKSSGGTRNYLPPSRVWTIAEAQAEVLRVASIIEANGGHANKESQIAPMNIGQLPSSIRNFAKENNIELDSNYLYFTTKGIEHSIRESKVEKGLSVTKEEIADFIANKHDMTQYYDPHKEDFIFATDKPKFIVTPNQSLKIEGKKTKVVNYITATRIKGNADDNFRTYIKIKEGKQ